MMDRDERMVAKAIVNDLLKGDNDIEVGELSGAVLTVNRTGFSAADEHTLRGRVVIGRHGAKVLDEYDIEIVVRRRRA